MRFWINGPEVYSRAYHDVLELFFQNHLHLHAAERLTAISQSEGSGAGASSPTFCRPGKVLSPEKKP